jgi:hypothetical protein
MAYSKFYATKPTEQINIEKIALPCSHNTYAPGTKAPLVRSLFYRFNPIHIIMHYGGVQ